MKSPCACTTVRKANRALFRFYEDALAPCAVTITQLAILRVLERNGPTPLSRLADELVMERTSLYRTIKPLERLGGIEISGSDFGRAKIASITARGGQLAAEATPHWDRAQETVIGLIGNDRWQELSETLLAIPNLLSKKT